MFVHGAGLDHTIWQLQTRYFAHHGRSVLAVDLPGHGRSEGPPLASIRELAGWLRDLIASVGARTAALVGHSMGAFVTLTAAAETPERVSALALLGVAARMPVHPELLDAARRDDHLAFDLVTSWGFGRKSHFGGHRGPGLWMTGGGVRLLERNAPGVLATDLAACDGFAEATQLACAIRCPTLLVLADRDRMTPLRGATELAEKVAGTRTVVLSECGHMMMVEKPDETLDALRGFL